MMAGMICVPVYPTANKETIEHIIEHSECKAIFIGKLDKPIEALLGFNAEIKKINFPYLTIKGHYQWQELLNGHVLKDVYYAKAHETLSIVYTSGSTGKPKGVVLTHENIAVSSHESAKIATLTEEDNIISYLPLAHIVERTLIEIASLYAGSKVYFVESLETFIEDVKKAQPSIFFSVPRLWSKFQSEILSKTSNSKLQLLLKIPLIKQWLIKKVQSSLGLSNARAFGSGSASISIEVIRWYGKIGIDISDGWGMTETAGTFCANMPFRKEAIGTLGKPLNTSEIKIGENNEILVRGLSVFKEYYKNSDATKKCFTNGWFHTGDMGKIMSNGDIKIIGRVKDKFKSAKGKYIIPAFIENLLEQQIIVEQTCVIGEARKQPIALIIMAPNHSQQTQSTTNKLQKILQTVNAKLESHQKLDNIIVLKKAWTAENNMLTPTLKIKRNEIEKKYQHYLKDKLDKAIFWEN
jgi:long-subunit acyl-CoA synthetase (AMP-forming)